MRTEHEIRRADCFSRRQWLAKSGLGIGALALEHLLSGQQAARAGVLDPQPPKLRHFPAKADRVIFLFMQGGPSHLETFDPKPELQRFHDQPLPESFRQFDLAQTNTADGKLLAPLFPFKRHGESGLAVSSLFPHLATHADKLAVVRSCYHESFIHGPALTLMNSGSVLLGHPSVGAWVVYGLGCECDDLPAYVALTDSMFRNGTATYSSGFLPAMYQGTYLRAEGTPIQNLLRPPQISSTNQRILLD